MRARADCARAHDTHAIDRPRSDVDTMRRGRRVSEGGARPPPLRWRRPAPRSVTCFAPSVVWARRAVVESVDHPRCGRSPDCVAVVAVVAVVAPAIPGPVGSAVVLQLKWCPCVLLKGSRPSSARGFRAPPACGCRGYRVVRPRAFSYLC